MCKKTSIFLAALFVLLASSCTSRLTDFTIISTKNVPIGEQPTNLSKAPTRVKGVDKAHFILFIPTGIPNLKEAIDKAIEKYPGAVALADGVAKSNSWNAILYGQTSYIVEGTPLYPTDMSATSSSQKPSSEKSSANNSFMRITHQVNQEKSVTELAKMYEVSVADIMKWNKLSSPQLTTGQEIIIFLPR